MASIIFLSPWFISGSARADVVDTFVARSDGYVGYVIAPNTLAQESRGDIPVGTATSSAVAESNGDLAVHAIASGGNEAIGRTSFAAAALEAAYTLPAAANWVDVSMPFTMHHWDSFGTRRFLPPVFATDSGVLSGRIDLGGGACADGSLLMSGPWNLQMSAVPGDYLYESRIWCQSDSELLAGSVVTLTIWLEARARSVSTLRMHADIVMHAGAPSFLLAT